MRLRRLLSMFLVVTLILSLGITTAFADEWKDESGQKFPPGLAKKGGLPPGIAKKIFNDIDNFPWAKQFIEKMFLKGLIQGYGNGIYKPKAAVTKLEAIIMALRVMGWEDEAKEIYYLPKNYKGEKVGDWAKGYVTLAYEKGILDDVDMMYFKPNDPAKRHEVAKYVIRALGYEEEAQDHMDEELPFEDAAAVPLGSVGYVYLINEMGLMQGDNLKRFNPMGTMTRAEMAVLFSRLDDKVDSDIDDIEVLGEVYRIHDETIALKIRGQIKLFEVDDEVRVYDGDDRIDYDDIEVGDKVRLVVRDGEVAYIELVDSIDDDKIISRYTGEVQEIRLSDPKRIALQAETMVLIFEVIDDVEVDFENGEGEFDEIEKGDEVTVVVDSKNRARHIYVHREREHEGWDDEIKGILTEIEDDEIEVTVNDEVYNFDIDDDIDIEIEGDEAELSDLVVGMEVEIKIEDGEVVSIEAKNVEYSFYGEIKDIDDDEITVERTNGDEEIYEVSEDVEIDIDGIRNPDIDDLREGDYAKFEVQNNIIVEIEVKDEIEEVEGILVSVDEDEIEINVDEEVVKYDLANNLNIDIEGYRDSLRYLKPGMKVEVRVRNDVVYQIYAEDNEFEVEGEITSITKSSEGFELTIKVEDETFEYMVDEDAEIEIEDVDNPDIDDLKVGQEGEFEVINNVIVKISIED